MCVCVCVCNAYLGSKFYCRLILLKETAKDLAFSFCYNSTGAPIQVHMEKHFSNYFFYASNLS